MNRPILSKRRLGAISVTSLALTLSLTVAARPALAQDTANIPGADVESLLTLAKSDNPEALGMRLDATAAQERIDQADALPDPRVKLELLDVTRSGTQNPTLWPADVGSTRYTLTQELPWFGTLSLRREQAQYAALGAQARAQATQADVALRVKLGYAQLYALQRNIDLGREVLDLLAHLEQLAQARYGIGLATQQDVLRVQAEQTNVQAELISMRSDLQVNRARMNALLGRAIQAPLADPLVLRDLAQSAQWDAQALERRAHEHNPQLAGDDATVMAAQKAQELVAKERYPSVTVGIAPTQMQNNVNTWDLMVEMNIPLWQSRRRSQEREAAAMREAAQRRREATQVQLQADLAAGLAELQSNRQTQDLYRTQLLPQADLALKSALASYEVGKADFATVLEAQRQIRSARQAQIKVLAEGQAKLAQIERLVGEE